MGPSSKVFSLELLDAIVMTFIINQFTLFPLQIMKHQKITSIFVFVFIVTISEISALPPSFDSEYLIGVDKLLVIIYDLKRSTPAIFRVFV